MKHSSIWITAISLAVVGGASAQEGRPERGPGGRGGMMRMSPIMVALDANKDGELSSEEIQNAATALKTLDKNGDGKLSADELRPAGGGMGGPGGNPEEMLARVMESDKNKDGKLSKDELPERMVGLLERGDTDKDGALSKEELKKAFEQRPRGPADRGEGRPKE